MGGKNWKAKIEAIWQIIRADGFSVASTIPTDRGHDFHTISVYSSDMRAAAIHDRIGDLFRHIHWVIKVGKKDMKDEQATN